MNLADDAESRLLEVLRPMRAAAVAFSGGVDSTVVAAAAFHALGAAAVAVTADSPSLPRSELQLTRELAGLIGIRHVVLPTEEFANPDYLRNDGTRCYHCKSELYDQILRHRDALGVEVICSGANLDDRGDYRPGLLAAAERSVRHPLQEAGFDKAAVRALARRWGLPNWDRPAAPCLSSRLAPGLGVTPERIGRVEAAEAWLRERGFPLVRVRHHEGDLARIEVEPSRIGELFALQQRDGLAEAFRQLGFRFVTIDLEGFRSGNMNALIPLEVRRRYSPS